MKHLKNKLHRKYIVLYFIWTIVFTIIPIAIVQPEKLTLRIIFIAFIISAMLSIPAIYYFLKALNRRAVKSGDIHFDLLPDERLILKTNAKLKKALFY